MILEVDGVQYSDFKRLSLSSRLDALCQQFSFEAVRRGNNALPFKGGEACRILDGTDVLLTGNIERLDVDYSDTGHVISLSGRSLTGDVVDSSLRAVGDYSGRISLKRCIELALKDIGSSIKVVDNAGGPFFAGPEDKVSPEPGENAFAFMEKLARKKQVLITSNGGSDIVITRAATVRSSGVLQNVLGATDNNILSGSVSFDGTGRYSKYTFASGGNPLSLNLSGVVSADDVASQGGSVTDTEVRSGRQLVMQNESSTSDGGCLERARWEADLRKARGRVYAVSVQGFRTGASDIWAVNTIVPVADDFTGITGNMLINDVTLVESSDRGSITSMTLMPPNAYTLQLEEPPAQEVGFGLV